MQIPLSTYRFQFNENFRFADAEKLVAYLQALGISHLYASPLLQARAGSLHGYDVTDPGSVSGDLGSPEDFLRLVEKLREHGIGLLLDIVPNHMAASTENPWWRDVLEQGEESKYASYFDIDWQASGSKFPLSQRGRVILPILSDYYRRLLEEQKITLGFGENGLQLEVEGNTLPLHISTYAAILERCLESMKSAGQRDGGTIGDVERMASMLRGTDTPVNPAEVNRQIWDWYRGDQAFHSGLDETLRFFRGTKGDPGSFARLNDLLAHQAYRTAFWRNASEEINYRRFFGLNELVGLRVEIPQVFRDTHALIRKMAAEGSVNGLRVDHIDGLRDPLAYLRQLQEIAIPDGRQDGHGLKIYTVVEKITSGREMLPPDWPTAGTTGYDYLNAVNTLFVDAGGSRELEMMYRDFTGIRTSFGETWNVRKKQVMEEIFAADVRRLVWRLGRLATFDRLGCDIPMRELTRGLKEITASLPIYRTYCRELKLSERDRPYLERAFAIMRERTPGSALSDAAFEFLRSVFLLSPSYDLASCKDEWLDFLLSWQQFTGAVMGKGLEDTAFFVHHGLISLNEVGANPLRKEIGFGSSAFHRYNQRTMGKWPFTLNATSTHDTKWSEDVRARINVLSEIPEEWKACLERWTRWNEPRKSMIEGRAAPSANEEVLLYQSMLGIWPMEGKPDEAERRELCQRLQQFILKAAREAKTHSSWTSPNEAHENALKRFVCELLDDKSENPFFTDFSEFASRIAPAGACNSYAQVLLKITSPGVPDFFQGNELWNLRLTDPDNRNHVDFEQRARLLQELRQGSTAEPQPPDGTELLVNWKDGRLKLYLTCNALKFRREHADLFLHGEYIPIETSGAQRSCVCAFARRFENGWAIIAVPRLVTRLDGGPFPLGEESWGTTRVALPPAAPVNWKNVFTGETIPAATSRRRKDLPLSMVFSRLPFALLAASDS